MLLDIGDDIYLTFPDTSYVYYKKALNLSRQVKSKKHEAHSLLYIGYYLDDKERHKESLDYYLKAIDLYKSIDDQQGVGLCYSYIGYSFSYLNSVDNAIKYYLKALEIFKEINDSIGIAEVNNGFGHLHYDIENYLEAFKYYKKTEFVYEKLNDVEGLVSVYTNLGNAISEYELEIKGDIKKGLKYYNKSVELAKEIDDKESITINYNNIGDTYIELGEPETAIVYLNKSLKLSKELNYEGMIPLIYSNIANAKLKLKDYNASILYANKSLNTTKNFGLKYVEYDNHEYLSESYEKLGDYKKAYVNYKLFKKFTDSVLTAKKFEQMAKLDVLTELEENENEINLLIKNEEIQKIKSKNQELIIYILLVFSISFLILTYYLEKQKRARKDAYNLMVIERDKAEESDRLKSAFLANMSHEIRTPMNAIMGFSGLLKSSDLTHEKRNHFIDIINISGERLMVIINDIVDISKIESNQIRVDLQEIKLNSVLTEIVEIQKKSNRELMKKDVKLNLISPIDYDGFFITTDQSRFVQIFNNLINNAVKFTEKGTIDIGYGLKYYREKAFLEFYVKDTGCGIPKDKFEAIFDRFSQAGENDFKTGNGLGLSICKGLITILKGQIWLESKENVGSTFYFTLPY